MANLRKDTQNKQELLEWFRHAPIKGLPQYVEGTEDEVLAGGGWKERKSVWGIFENQGLWYYVETDAENSSIVIRKEFADERSAAAYARENLERKIREAGDGTVLREAKEKSQPCSCPSLGQKELLEKQMEDKEKVLAAIEEFMADLEKKYSELDEHIEELEKQRRETLADKVKAEIDAETANQKVLMISKELEKVYKEKKDAKSSSDWMKRRKKQVLEETDRIRQEYESLDAEI